MITGYELGQFLRILLWIFVPMVIFSMLVTTWLHYRRRRRNTGEVLLSIEGFGHSQEEFVMPLRVSSEAIGQNIEAGKTAGSGGGSEDEVSEEYRETVYKGILWMKKKYEQYRDLSDRRYERLKEELARSEKKYDDLLASIVEVKVGDRREKLLSATAHAQVEERAVRGSAEGLDVSGAGDPQAEEVEMAPRAVSSADAAPGESATGGHAASGPVVAERADGRPAMRERSSEQRPVPAGGVTPAELERDSLRDLLAERNQQIIFLQRQLDQRIKDFHMAEHEGRGARGQIQELEEQAARTRQRLEEEVDRIRHQLDDEIARGRRQLEEQAAESKRQLEEQVANAERKLEERQRVIVELEEQIHILRQKIEELVDKLRNNSQLLLNIYQELDKSLRSTDAPAQP
jgi:chromosome segregation ATPase